MLNSLRRSFGMSPSSSSIHADYTATNDVPASVLSPSNKPNTFVPIRRSNSFTNFFSSSPPSSPIKENFDQSPSKTMTSSAKASFSAACEETAPDPVLAFLILLDKKGRQMERFPIQGLMTTMGRSLENDVRFLGSDISRHHCTIEIEIEQEQSTDGTKAFLQVLGVNGVLLNSTQVYPAPRGKGRYELATGDSIVIAKRPFLFELPQKPTQTAAPSIFTSPVKGSAQSAVPQTPATTINRRVRMSLVNAAQIDTPSKPSAARQLASLSKTNNAEREARRANGLQRFIQSAGVSPSKANKSGRQSLSLSTSTSNIFATPVKSRSTTVEPKTAPPNQVSFSLRSSGYSGRMSPVKQMRMMPPLDTMNEEQDGSFCSEDEQLQEQQEVQEEAEDQEESAEDIVIVEEIEQEQAQPAAPMEEAEEVAPVTYDNASKDRENLENIFSTQSSSSTPAGSPSKSVSPKRAKRRSSFFGRSGPFAGMSLGFYAEERSEPAPVEPEQQPPQPELPAEEFSDASGAEPTPMEDEQPLLSPITHRVSSRPMKLGISKTPSPVKKQHFIGLTPLPRRPRLSLATKRNVSLRTKTLLRSSEAYADRLFLPPPPPTPSSPESGGLSKSVSMPSNLSAMTPPPAFDTSSCSAVEDVQELQQSEEVCKEVCEEVREEDDFESRLDPALSEEAQPQAWKGDSDDEDEVDQSLSCLSPSPQKTAPSYLFSPVKTSSLPHFATPQPMSKSHARRISMPPIGVADAKPSNRSALVRLQISGSGERIVHENPRKPEAPQVEQASPSKARKVARVSEVGLPATELSMGFDVLQGASAEQEPEEIAEALNDLFNAEEEELTDVEEEPEKQEEIVQINSSPARRSAPQMPPQTPAALNSIRHMFSAAANTAPATPDMNGLATMLQTSPEKTAQYGTLGDRMRANPEISQLLSPANASRRKEAEVEASPIRGRRGVRSSEVAEMPVALPATPKASVAREASSLPSPFVQAEREPEPAFEAELYVTMFDAAEMDAQNEAIIQAFAEAEEQQGSEQGGVLEQEADLEPEAGFEQKAEPEPIYQPDPDEELVQDAPLEEVATEEPVALSDSAEQAHVEEEQVVEPVHEAAIVKESVIEEPIIVKPVAAEPSLVKPRAASESPTKRTAARSDSPTKRNTRSSPVKRASAAEPNGVFEEESSAPVVEEVPVESSSPTKPTRRTGGRKAKLAATEAISAGFTVEVPPPTSSPQKPAGRTKAAAASKKAEAQAAEPEHDEREVAEEEAPPKVRSTRTRTTRPAAAPAKAVRSTRNRGAKDAQPSSSAGFGDDEASEAEEEAKGKKIVKARTAAAPKSKSTRSTRAAAAVEDSDSDLAEVKEQEEAPKPKTRATRAKAAPATTSRSKARKADAEEAATSSSATTTRSGRTTRRTAAAK
ncbi:hypothetical protein NDA10_000753 [Ustilago hordei]|uniref:FHA domain-containing protein n=1 Tax=Ustilago hordei TaxID=120017 RepID=I2FQC4_USTHO|nr:uncharacterized protein UHO2_06296 [Ustilago hordei]KAJ1038495.1 hypothetical protein NDA10_000753 [Ustilago hordei]CCF49117.1 uncharacterized protein UHOR_08535 [Ustilago hordei]SYW80834.1 uncharacterized protein UHO2_06296 [Ustilago hordei]